ncbi:MAG: hypothetical protein WBA16_04765 [Nonlabens sp.]
MVRVDPVLPNIAATFDLIPRDAMFYEFNLSNKPANILASITRIEGLTEQDEEVLGRMVQYNGFELIEVADDSFTFTEFYGLGFYCLRVIQSLK